MKIRILILLVAIVLNVIYRFKFLIGYTLKLCNWIEKTTTKHWYESPRFHHRLKWFATERSDIASTGRSCLSGHLAPYQREELENRPFYIRWMGYHAGAYRFWRTD